MGTNVNFYQEPVYLTFIFRILVFIFSTNKSKFLKQFYNMGLWKLPSQHGDASVLKRVKIYSCFKAHRSQASIVNIFKRYHLSHEADSYQIVQIVASVGGGNK